MGVVGEEEEEEEGVVVVLPMRTRRLSATCRVPGEERGEERAAVVAVGVDFQDWERERRAH